MLFTKSILKPILPQDGIRISVMSRHTLEDGITPDSRITEKSYNEHLIFLAPPPKLVGDYYKRNLPWDKFEERFLDYLNKPKVAILVNSLSARALAQNITLLCIEDSPQFCHRRLLAEECKKYQPSLEVIHR